MTALFSRINEIRAVMDRYNQKGESREGAGGRSHAMSVFRRKPHDDIPGRRPIELERFLLEVHAAVSDRLKPIRLWNVADRDGVLAVSQAQDECACPAALRGSSRAFAFDYDGGGYSLRSFEDHMSRDEDVAGIGNRDTGHVFVTNRNLRLSAKPQVHNVVAWKDLRECKRTIGADRSFEGRGKISGSRFPQCDSVDLSWRNSRHAAADAHGRHSV